ncbi:MAG TPA: TIGR03936 family radical SAM-associated protein, partial [Anaerolineales bacterium]|nr:TIGR03936 family radical SAM-associated protein [Anaerolineales bacterium]
ALPLGFTSDCEMLDAWLEEQLPLAHILGRLRAAAPPGIRVLSAAEADERAPALQVQLRAAEYVITLLDPVEGLAQRVESLLAADTLPRERRGQPYDLRVLLQALAVLPPDEDGQPRLSLRLMAQEGATGRPEEVLEQLGYDPLRARIQRTRLIFAEEHL